MAESTTVVITDTTPGGGSRFFTESGRKNKIDVSGLTPYTEYEAQAEYEKPDGTVIQTTQGVTFRTLAAGMFSVSNPVWQSNAAGTASTLTFDFTSTYALSWVQVVLEGVTYQGSISGNSVTVTGLPYYSAGTQKTFQITLADIYEEEFVQGYILTITAYVPPIPPEANVPFYIELVDPTQTADFYIISRDQGASMGTTFYNTIQYSYDNISWSTYKTWNEHNYSHGPTMTLNSTHPKVYLRKTEAQVVNTSLNRDLYFQTSGSLINVGGNIASLKNIDFTDTIENKFGRLFGKFWDTVDQVYTACTNIQSAGGLYLGNYNSIKCNSMFRDCTSLTTPPSLPATTLADECYSHMFSGCTGLTSIPSGLLPATTLANHCYDYMFQGCTGLTSIPSGLLPATTLVNSCYYYMFSGCTGLTSIPSGLLPATTLADSCYNNMFRGCTGLTQSPILPATTLVNSCYDFMFYKCTSLREITCLAEDNSASGTTSWVSNVASTGTFYKSSRMSSWTTGSSGIPSNWTVQDYSN